MGEYVFDKIDLSGIRVVDVGQFDSRRVVDLDDRPVGGSATLAYDIRSASSRNGQRND